MSGKQYLKNQLPVILVNLLGANPEMLKRKM